MGLKTLPYEYQFPAFHWVLGTSNFLQIALIIFMPFSQTLINPTYITAFKDFLVSKCKMHLYNSNFVVLILIKYS